VWTGIRIEHRHRTQERHHHLARAFARRADFDFRERKVHFCRCLFAVSIIKPQAEAGDLRKSGSHHTDYMVMPYCNHTGPTLSTWGNSQRRLCAKSKSSGRNNTLSQQLAVVTTACESSKNTNHTDLVSVVFRTSAERLGPSRPRARSRRKAHTRKAHLSCVSQDRTGQTEMVRAVKSRTPAKCAARGRCQHARQMLQGWRPPHTFVFD